MPPIAEAPNPLVLLAATLLRVPGRRLRALALGDDAPLREWIANESATRLAEARRDARVASARLEQLGGRVVSLGDAAYPAGLRDLADPPAFLCVVGALPARAFRTGTAIVGARDADDEARTFAFELARRAAAPIVSGLALGVDAAAHEGALAANVPTLAYVGHGFGATYPPEHAELEARIVAAGGAILSEYLPGESVTKWSLVRRDRLQAAHVTSVVLVVSERDGGAMHAMTTAKKLGRSRFALAPRGAQRDSGNWVAIHEGATSVSWNSSEAADALAGSAFSTPTLFGAS
jgi:DNA protecting protein DprA